MALTPGSRLGQYEIAAPIGAGGMGEVYRARDTRLGRDVAVKVISDGFAADADSGNGYLLLLRDGVLVAQALDERTFDLAGDPVVVADHVGAARTYGWFTASQNGVIAYRTRPAEFGLSQLTWFDRSGKVLGTLGQPGSIAGLALSRDGKHVAHNQISSDAGANSDVWTIDVDRGAAARLTSSPAADFQPVWLADGKSLVFASTRSGLAGIYRKEAGGMETEKAISKPGIDSIPYDVSPDGRLLLYGVNSAANKWDLWTMPLDGSGSPAPFVEKPFHEVQGQFSPGEDPLWVAYASDESGAFEIYAQPLQGGTRYLISKGGGTEPRWNPDGSGLYYLSPARTLMSVKVKFSPQFEAGVPQELFATGAALPTTFYPSHYAVSRDGKRFLVVRAQEKAAAVPITVILNWRPGAK